MDKCPHCKQKLGGKMIGSIDSPFYALLRKIHLDAEQAALFNEDISEKDCPFERDKEPAQYFAWIGGMYYVRCKRLLNPQKVKDWVITNPDLRPQGKQTSLEDHMLD